MLALYYYLLGVFGHLDQNTANNHHVQHGEGVCECVRCECPILSVHLVLYCMTPRGVVWQTAVTNRKVKRPTIVDCYDLVITANVSR